MRGRLADQYFHGNRSLAVRAALESLATHTSQDGRVVAGFIPVVLDEEARCNTCGTQHEAGELLYRPVFERGSGPASLSQIPIRPSLHCPGCLDREEAAA